MLLRTANAWQGLLLSAFLTWSLTACAGSSSDEPDSGLGSGDASGGSSGKSNAGDSNKPEKPGKGDGKPGKGTDDDEDDEDKPGTETPDTAGPSLAITSPSTSGTYRTALTSIDLEGSAADDSGVASVTWKNSTTGERGVASGTTTWRVSRVSLTEGENAIEVTAKDTRGNKSAAAITITSDTKGPVLEVTKPTGTDLVVLTEGLKIEGAAADSSGVESVTWSNVTLEATGAASWVADGQSAWVAEVPLAEGSNEIKITATDEVENASVETLTVTRDTEPPTLAIASPAEGERLVAAWSVDVAGSSADAGGVVLVTWRNLTTGSSGTASGTTEWSISALPLQEGPNEIEVTVKDVAGRTESDTVTITADTSGPALAVTTEVIPTPVLGVPFITLEGTSSDASGVAAVSWKNITSGEKGEATGTSSWTAADIPLVNGTNELEIIATDVVGNTSSLTIGVISDVEAPTVTILSPTGSDLLVKTTTISMFGKASDEVSGVVSVAWKNEATGATGLASGKNDWSVSSLAVAEGANEIEVTAIDAVGNSATSSVTVTRDTLPPSLTISTPQTGDWIASSTATVVGTATDPSGVVSVEWRNLTTGMAGYATGTSSFQAKVPLIEGENVLEILATDFLDHVTTETVTVTSDVSGPVLSIASPSSTGTFKAESSPIALSGTAADDAGVDKVTWANLTTGESGTASGTTSWSVAEVSLANGLNTIKVTALDTVGNATSRTLVVNFNHAPSDVKLNLPGEHFLIPSLHREGEVAAKLSAEDPDPDNTFTFAFDGGDDDEAFQLTPEGELTPLFAPNPIVKASYALRIKVTDNSGDSQSFDKVVFVAEGSTFTFGTCGRTDGREGPTAAECEEAYAGTNLEGEVLVTTQGYQQWVVPATGSYYIVAAGAQGGNGNNGNGGNGAIMRGSFELNAGDVLTLVVGQRGTSTNNTSPGGGGGTFVVKDDPTSNDVLAWNEQPVRLLIAAGGGGGGTCAIERTGMPGTTSLSGSPNPGGHRLGGTNGNGGQGHEWAAGGAGFRGNGEGERAPLSFLNGALGGEREPVCLYAPYRGGEGGFGGGAGGNGCDYAMCGAAGGYSGGGAGYPFGGDAYTGGGGGSFNAGAAQWNASGANSGPGFVQIIELK